MTRSADMLDDTYPHGTVDGHRRGCRGSHCPALITCRDVYRRYQGDFAFRRAIEAGTPLADIVAADTAAHADVANRDRAAARAARRPPTADVEPNPTKLLKPRRPPATLHPKAAAAPTPEADPILKYGRLHDDWRTRQKQLRSEFRAAHADVRRIERLRDRAATRLDEHAALEPKRPAKPVQIPRPPQPKGPRSKVADADIIRLHAAGLSDRLIGAQVGVTAQRVCQLRKRLHLASHHPRKAAA